MDTLAPNVPSAPISEPFIVTALPDQAVNSKAWIRSTALMEQTICKSNCLKLSQGARIDGPPIWHWSKSSMIKTKDEEDSTDYVMAIELHEIGG